MHVRFAEVDGNFIKIYRDIAQRTFTRQGKEQVDI